MRKITGDRKENQSFFTVQSHQTEASPAWFMVCPNSPAA